LFSPVLAMISLVALLTEGRPVVFRQTRPGLHERPFEILKFRTMSDACDERGDPLPDERRITPLGRLLRKTSLDELPELLNVLGGSMSLVGPRPLLMRYLPYFRQEERKRFQVRPGITGLAQVHGRNSVSWDQRLAFDVSYCERISLALDVKILALTVREVLFARGVAVLPSTQMADLDEERRARP